MDALKLNSSGKDRTRRKHRRRTTRKAENDSSRGPRTNVPAGYI